MKIGYEKLCHFNLSIIFISQRIHLYHWCVQMNFIFGIFGFVSPLEHTKKIIVLHARSVAGASIVRSCECIAGHLALALRCLAVRLQFGGQRIQRRAKVSRIFRTFLVRVDFCSFVVCSLAMCQYEQNIIRNRDLAVCTERSECDQMNGRDFVLLAFLLLLFVGQLQLIRQWSEKCDEKKTMTTTTTEHFVRRS